MTRNEKIDAAYARILLSRDPSHADWYEGLESDAEFEMLGALSIPDHDSDTGSHLRGSDQ